MGLCAGAMGFGARDDHEAGEDGLVFGTMGVGHAEDGDGFWGGEGGGGGACCGIGHCFGERLAVGWTIGRRGRQRRRLGIGVSAGAFAQGRGLSRGRAFRSRYDGTGLLPAHSARVAQGLGTERTGAPQRRLLGVAMHATKV